MTKVTAITNKDSIFYNPNLHNFINNQDNFTLKQPVETSNRVKQHYNNNKQYYTNKKNLKRKNDSQYKAYDSGLRYLRSIIHHYLKGKIRETDVFLNVFGYTKAEFINHISQDLDIQNYSNEWHIDHIISYKHFNFISRECPEFKLAFSLKNLRGLDKKLNQTRSRMNKY